MAEEMNTSQIILVSKFMAMENFIGTCKKTISLLIRIYCKGTCVMSPVQQALRLKLKKVVGLWLLEQKRNYLYYFNCNNIICKLVPVIQFPLPIPKKP
ncbi:hypothetical protein C0J52_05487 [Blattella germanica]|nr:hypothetical protein C0J52_05487 [Blattella germanica]